MLIAVLGRAWLHAQDTSPRLRGEPRGQHQMHVNPEIPIYQYTVRLRLTLYHLQLQEFAVMLQMSNGLIYPLGRSISLGSSLQREYGTSIVLT